MAGNDESSPQVTRLLAAWREGDREALDRLMPLVEQELRRLASRQMSGQRRGHTLQTTALVNEAYLRLAGKELGWQDRAHFFAAAATTMRSVLVDHARSRRRVKRGSDPARVTLDDVVSGGDDSLEAMLDLDAALDSLAEQDARKARAIELHHFAGLSYREIAYLLEISEATVHRELRIARAWLQRELNAEPRE